MKKAFCEPGNIVFNPPITLLSHFSLSNSSTTDAAATTTTNVTIERSEANGGNITYACQKEIEDDFASNKLHPADLKNATSKVMVNVLTGIFEGLKVDNDAKNACKVLKNAEKKMAKKGLK